MRPAQRTLETREIAHNAFRGSLQGKYCSNPNGLLAVSHLPKLLGRVLKFTSLRPYLNGASPVPFRPIAQTLPITYLILDETAFVAPKIDKYPFLGTRSSAG
jgi:hypothetical protein